MFGVCVWVVSCGDKSRCTIFALVFLSQLLLLLQCFVAVFIVIICSNCQRNCYFDFSIFSRRKNCVTPEKDLLIVIQQIPISKMSCFCYTNCVYSLSVLILCQRFPGQ